MLKRAARLETREIREEIRQLMNDFQQTQPDELLKICHSVLSEFLELRLLQFRLGPSVSFPFLQIPFVVIEECSLPACHTLAQHFTYLP